MIWKYLHLILDSDRSLLYYVLNINGNRGKQMAAGHELNKICRFYGLHHYVYVDNYCSVTVNDKNNETVVHVRGARSSSKADARLDISYVRGKALKELIRMEETQQLSVLK